MAHRQLHFGLNVLSAGMHPAAWLAKESDPLGYIKPEQWLRLVQIAQQGTFDAIFLADEPGLGSVVKVQQNRVRQKVMVCG